MTDPKVPDHRVTEHPPSSGATAVILIPQLSFHSAIRGAGQLSRQLLVPLIALKCIRDFECILYPRLPSLMGSAWSELSLGNFWSQTYIVL